MACLTQTLRHGWVHIAQTPQTGHAWMTHVQPTGHARATQIQRSCLVPAVRVSCRPHAHLTEEPRMSDAPTDGLRPAVAAFQKSAGPKMETLLPHRGAVVELRSKGASFSLIARLLERIGIHVSTDTLRRLCARPPSALCDAPADPTPTASVTPSSSINLSNRPPAPTISPSAPRGPRIAAPSGQ